MNDDVKKILDNNKERLDDERLMAYVNKDLNKQDYYQVEKTITEDEFTSDAVEGLQQISNADDLPDILSDLNTGLHKQLGKAKKKRRKRWKDDPKIYLLVIILLILMIIGYLVTKKAIVTNPKNSTRNFRFDGHFGQAT